MTKVSEPPASKLQELLADYLSQNLKDSEDEAKRTASIAEDNPDDQNSSKRHKKHKHKSKKKKKKSHHLDREDESRHDRTGRSHHRKHRHSEKDRHSGSKKHRDSKDENSESKEKITEKILKERTLADVTTVSCNKQPKFKDEVKVTLTDSKEKVSRPIDSKTESPNVLQSIKLREVSKSEEKLSAVQKFFRDSKTKDVEKSNDSEEKTSPDSKPELPTVLHKIDVREVPKSQKKLSPLKSFFRDSMTNWRDKEAQKLIDETVVTSRPIVLGSENQKERMNPEKANDCKKKVSTDSKGAIRITINSNEKRNITDYSKESVTKDSKNVWHNVVPSIEGVSGKINIVKGNTSKNSLNVKSKDIEKEKEPPERVIGDSVIVRQKDENIEKVVKVGDENKDTGKATDIKAKVGGVSYNVWYKVDLDSEKRKLTDECKYVEKAMALEKETDRDSNIEKQNYNDQSKEQNIIVESKEIHSRISDIKLNENISKKDAVTNEQSYAKWQAPEKLETNDQSKKVTSELERLKPSKSFDSSEKPSVGAENVKPDNTDSGNISFNLPRKTEDNLLSVGDNEHSHQKVIEANSLVDNFLLDLSKSNTETLPTVEEVQVSVINSTTAVTTESDLPGQNHARVILAASTLNVMLHEDGTSVGDVMPQSNEVATKPKGKIVIKDLTVCHALKNAEEERLLKLSQMEEGEVEDSAGENEENEAVNSGRSTPQTDEGSGLISEEENKMMLKKKKRKRSKHKEKRKKRKLEKGQSKIERSHSSSKRERKSKDGYDQKSQQRRDSFIEKGENSSQHERISSPSRKVRSRSPHHKGSTNRTRSPQHRARSRSPLRRGRSPPRGGRITSPLRGFRLRDRRRSPNKQPQIFRDLREKIDKKKLLEIARKNVLQMMQDGTLPAGLNVNALKQEQVIAIKAGGKGVNELTEFCRSLVETGDDSSSDEKQLSDEESDMPFIHHPFKLRDLQPTIRLNIRNAVQLPTRTPAEKTVDAAKLRLQFPVSSGSHHRNHEMEWVPVEKSEESPSQKKSKEPVPQKPVMDLSSHPLAQFIAPGPLRALAPPPPPPPLPPPPPPLPIEKINEVFPSQKSLSMDIASAMLMRVKAVQRLQENPHDMEALNQMYHAQQQMQEWAQSKLLPGQFGALGDTRMLTPEELSGPTPVWVKKELFIKAAPLRGGIGMHLLKKMGWNPGEGLGKNKEGSLEPLMLDIKTDKKGLVSTGELPQKTVLPTIKMPRDLSAKHPVSALMELCSKRKWGTPDYTLLDETGPAHRKTFLFKVKVKGVDYQPSVSSSNKKQAKALAASVCLQSMGLLPRNINKPL